MVIGGIGIINAVWAFWRLLYGLWDKTMGEVFITILVNVVFSAICWRLATYLTEDGKS
jgi:hypothetical protein